MVNKTGQYMLWVHDQQFSKEELVVNPDHFPKLKVGDILEIASPTNISRKLCLRVKTLAPVKGALQISIAKYIAQVFDFASRREVIVNVIPDKNAIVEFVEVSFKDQYIGRSDMWRLKLSLQNECVYVYKKLAFAQVRAQVEEMVSKGQKVSSGLIDESTKFVFRSRSAKFILLIQMSKEMWDFADDGDLYFEKAVNGFLKSLFNRWKSLSVNHTITIILFSRTFYENTEILDEIPNIPRNSQGVLFQDFYKVIVSDETRQDWSSVIVNLKREFNNYHQMVNWDIYGRNSALGKNSTSSQGNFLEAINLGMSYFDKHYIDRDFTRTGQMIVVVSPGTGIFEVDPEINLVTKQRMIDNGYGCDLICLNKHPLHIVPLFKYSLLNNLKSNNNSSQQSIENQSNNQQNQQNNTGNIVIKMESNHSINNYSDKSLYNVPYWLAISFFDEVIEQQQQQPQQNKEKETFKPQFRIPDPPNLYYNLNMMEKPRAFDFFVPKDPRKLPAFANQKPPNKYTSHTLGVSSYEDTIFNIPETMSGESHVSTVENPSIVVDDYVQSDNGESEPSDNDIASSPTLSYLARKRNSVNLIKPSTSHEQRPSFVIKKNQIQPHNMGSLGGNSFEHRSGGIVIGGRTAKGGAVNPTSPILATNIAGGGGGNILITKKPAINPFTYDDSPFHLTSNRRRWSHLWFSPNTYIFGKTNANPNPFLPNWKSLCEPASLPITTDYFPTQKDLLTKYIEYVHTLTLSPDDNEYHNNTEALLKELISQRLAQGYQLIMNETIPIAQQQQQTTTPTTGISTMSPSTAAGGVVTSNTNLIQPMTSSTPPSSLIASPTSSSIPSTGPGRNKRVYQLSLGHDFHVVTYDPSNLSIQVKRYQRHNGRTKSTQIKYKYYLCTMYSNTFTQQTVNISRTASGSYPWNSLDNLICGTISEIKTNLKYWRVQFAIVPLSLQHVSNLHQQQQQNNNNNNNQNQNNNQIVNSSENLDIKVINNNTTTTEGHTPSGSSSNSNTIGNSMNIPIPTTSPPIQSPSLSPTTNLAALNIINQQQQLQHQQQLLQQHQHQQQSQLQTHQQQQHLLIGGSISAPTSPVSVHKAKMQTHGNPPSQLKPTSLTTSATTSPNTSQEILGSSDNTVVVVEQSEEDRIASLTKFKEYINSLIAKNSNQVQQQQVNSTGNRMEVKNITFAQLNAMENTLQESTTLPLFGGDPNSSFGNSLDGQQLLSVRERLQASNVHAIFARMNLPQPFGLKMVDRKHLLRTYKKCFVGSEAIDWILQNVELSTREEAMNLTLQLVELKYIKSVEKTQFVDGFHYYRLKEDDSFNSNLSAIINKGKKDLVKGFSLLNMNSNEEQQQQQQQQQNNSSIPPLSTLPTTTTGFNVNNNSNNSGNEPNSPKGMQNSTGNLTSPTMVGGEPLLSPSQSPKVVPGSRSNLQMSNSYLEPGPYVGGAGESLKTSTGLPTPPYLNNLHFLSPGNNISNISNSSMLNNRSMMSNPPTPNNIIDTYENPNRCEEEKIEMDPTKTDRYEWIMFKHDKSFCPTKFFHLEFKWMVCTGCVVDDFVQSCIRKAKQVGLTLIQVPIEKNYSPFYAPVHLPLANKFMQPDLLKMILTQFNFIPDLLCKRPSSLVTRNDLYLFTDEDVPHTEYIHRSGMLFLRIVQDGFLAIINHAPTNRMYLSNAQSILKSFQEFINQLNSSIPAIVLPPDQGMSESPLLDDIIGRSVSPQTNLLRTLPPGEVNFLSLFSQGYTLRNNSNISNPSHSDAESDSEHYNRSGGSTSGNIRDSNRLHSSTDQLSEEEQFISDHQNVEAMWESHELLYYSSLMASNMTHNENININNNIQSKNNQNNNNNQ